VAAAENPFAGRQIQHQGTPRAASVLVRHRAGEPGSLAATAKCRQVLDTDNGSGGLDRRAPDYLVNLQLVVLIRVERRCEAARGRGPDKVAHGAAAEDIPDAKVADIEDEYRITR
jgi:hypothetical protein